MKKIFLPLFAVIALSYSASAQSTDRHALSLGASLGFLKGEGEKIVYRGTGSNDKLSQLLWKMDPLFYAGIDAHYEWQRPEKRRSVFADTLIKFGFPSEAGIMEDRDWIALNYPGFLTHYSVHDNKTEDAVIFDMDAGMSFHLFKTFLLKTYISYNFMRFSWRANGGSILHPSWDSNNDGKPDGDHSYLMPIDVITYEQSWHTLSPGIAFYGEFNRYFDIDISLELSPFVWSSGRDNHILRNLVITEDLGGGFFVEPRFVFSFKPNDILTVSLSAAYKKISGARGNSTYNENGQVQTDIPKQIGGAGYAAFDTGIVAKFNIIK